MSEAHQEKSENERVCRGNGTHDAESPTNNDFSTVPENARRYEHKESRGESCSKELGAPVNEFSAEYKDEGEKPCSLLPTRRLFNVSPTLVRCSVIKLIFVGTLIHKLLTK
ncbi:hypothetical protein HHI36_023714 [Cryptolaemus montrouzieri]|uniref:Uncharacterized protein n=1 Tax=Cryptolaemus montrouzieri TaxID=559131 RepID=A0ABD2PHV3_9CUCU